MWPITNKAPQIEYFHFIENNKEVTQNIPDTVSYCLDRRSYYSGYEYQMMHTKAIWTTWTNMKFDCLTPADMNDIRWAVFRQFKIFSLLYPSLIHRHDDIYLSTQINSSYNYQYAIFFILKLSSPAEWYDKYQRCHYCHCPRWSEICANNIWYTYTALTIFSDKWHNCLSPNINLQPENTHWRMTK